MLIYTLRIKRKEIRENQIKYARTLLTCINEEGASAALMTKDLRLLRESGIKNALQERLITAAYTTSTCVHLHIGIFFFVGQRERQSSCIELCILRCVY